MDEVPGLGPMRDGLPEPLGASADGGGGNIAVVAPHAEAVEFCLFDEAGLREVARLRLPSRTGAVWHGHLPGLRPGMRYGFRAHGPWQPSAGQRFNPAKLLLDPFATELDRPLRLHPAMLDAGREPDPIDSAFAMAKAIVPRNGPSPRASPPPRRGPHVIYELHVRGFTKLHPEVPEAIRGTFAGLAHPAAIAHLRALGVTMVELMPVAAGIEERHLPPLGLTNYWNYNPVAFLAPDPRLAPGGMAEVQAAVDALHDAGIAVVLDVVFNHTGEGDHLGPTLSLRGLDNVGFYRLRRDDPARYVDDAGCGNTLALDRAAPLRLAMDALRHWTLHGGVDGFRLDLATTLGRRTGGFDPEAPLILAMRQDPVLRDRIVVAEPWDIGPGGYRLGEFPPGWGEWNDRFRDTVRRYWRGEAGLTGGLATALAGSADVFGQRGRRVSDSVNFVAAHDGFTLADLVSYERKRNWANGEDNRDGTNANHSWNCGAEGPTEDPVILARRKRDVRALLATLLLSRGTPMLSMGDEAGRSQGGNNNAYAQDNTTSWFDWASMDHGLVDFTARLISVRLACSALVADRPLMGAPRDASGIPDVAWRRLDGQPMRAEDWGDPRVRSLAAALYEPAGEGTSASRALVALHAEEAEAELVLPRPRQGFGWRLVVDSASPERVGPATAERIRIAARSVLLFVEAPDA